MSDKRVKQFCPECGLELPEGETRSGCPNCLLRLALGDEAADAPNSATQLPLPPGLKSRFFGDYELLEEIARGGMGLVYRARQLSLNRVVALKMIHGAHLASPEARLRFRVEIETIAQLNHPNIVSLYEAAEHEGTHFFSMRLIDGLNLAQYMKKSPGLRDKVRLLVKICRAVHYAHQCGILHRDLKPSNILIDPDGQPHVVDFGLAKTLARESGFTFHESILGSPNYMAPEQAAGRTAQLTTTTDVYGLGAILYEMLTGRPPFQAGTPLDTIRKVVDEEPISPRKLDNGVDIDLETICLRCLQKNPAVRYSSAEELATDLERWLEGKPILARPIGRLEQLSRWCRREPALASALTASGALLLTLTAVACLAALRIGRAEHESRANLRESLLNQAHLLRLTSGLQQRSEGLRLIRQALALGGPAAFRDRTRDEVLALLVRNDLRVVDQPSIANDGSDPALSTVDTGLNLYASLSGSNTIVVRRIDNGSEVSRFSCGEEPVRRVEQFSSDGYLALRHPDGISIWNVHTGERSFATNGENRVYCFALNQPLLVLEEWDCQATFLELPSFREVRRVRGTVTPPDRALAGWSAMSLSPNGRQLAVGRSDVLEIINIETDKVRRRFTNSAPITALAWNPDDRRIAVALSNARIVVWNSANGERRINMPSAAAPAHGLVFNPGGDLLAAACDDRVLRFLDMTAIRYGYETTVTCDVQNFGFSSDGQRLGRIFRAGRPGCIEIAPPAEFREYNVASTSIELEGCVFSPDGRTLAAGNLTNIVICDATSGTRLTSLPHWRITAFSFDPLDGAVHASFTPGMFRLDLSRDDGQFRLENERKLFSGRGWRAFTFSSDGSSFVAANIYSNAAYVLDRTFTNQMATLGPHIGADFVAISDNGKWVATGSSADRQVKLWDTQSGRELLARPVGQRPRAAFSADNKWFVTFGDNFELRDTESWKPVQLAFRERPSLLGAAGFSPDSRLLAVVRDNSRIQLFDLRSLQPLGILQAPGGNDINAVAFSPDGTKLVGVGAQARLRMWNLPAIRQRLAELSLDWDIPQFRTN